MTKLTTIIAAAAVIGAMASSPVTAWWGGPGGYMGKPDQFQRGAGGPQGMAPGRYPGNAATGNYGQPPRMPTPQGGNPNVAYPGYGYGQPGARAPGMHGR